MGKASIGLSLLDFAALGRIVVPAHMDVYKFDPDYLVKLADFLYRWSVNL